MNIRQLWRKRKSIVVTWLVSYSAVLIVPILISLVIYSQASQALKSEIHRANDSLLKQMGYTIDNQIDLMKRLNTEVAWNQNLQTLMYSNKQDKSTPYTAHELVDEFRLYKTSYASIDEFYVVWNQDSSVLRPGNIRSLPVAFQTIHDTGAMTYEQWKEAVLGGETNRFTLLPREGAGESEASIAYITHLPRDLNGRETGTVVVMADTKRFQDAIESISGFNGGLVLILNQDNEVLLSNHPDAPELAPFMDGSHVRLTSPRVGDSELFYIPSAKSNLKYALIIPSRLYWEKAEYVRSFTYISILISLIGAGVLTWFFMRRNYSPIQELVQTLTDKTADKDRPDDWNELHLIRKAIMSARSEKDEIALQLQKHQHVLRSNLINRLLKGRLDSLVPYEEAFRSYHMTLLSSHFAVILFVVENEESLYANLPGIDVNERRKLIQFIIANVVEELAQQHQHVGYVAEADDMIVCLVNLRPDAENGPQDLHDIALEAQSFLRRYDMELTISTSGCHPSWAGIAEAYQEAVDAMEYKMVLGKQGIISYEDIRSEYSDRAEYGYYYPLQVEQQLINFIKAGDMEQASAYMDEITTRNFEKPLISLTIAKCLIFNLAGTMVKAINELGEGDILASNPLWMDKIIACDTIQEMQKELHAMLGEVCSFAAAKRVSNLTQEREDSLRDLTAKVTQYIERNYQDVNLNVNAIGEYFDLKGSYLSKLFKTQTGEGLLDCIHKFRIEHAKRMIRDKQESINEISRLVGYNDAATFIRVFKKYEGITPGKYKEIC
ncbi:helix-turn-helix domain-containing protein [Paenibacillus protaetiae]|uniref:helix-turn-helix domain-containing protein n=1 Tax=Paenibacillus protaetiae TaxID=2509456 RepID=UPI001FC98FE9|nr:helix-turn-helix domain-containing protein [Paenibacillus protaetiae]